jgi:hypothetical protein
MNASANWLTAWAASLDSKTAYDTLRRALAWSWLAPPPRATPRKIAGPALRALGPTRTAKALALGAWYAAAWSWRSESKDKHAARYAAMAVTQEGMPSVRVKVKAAMAGRPVPNDNVPQLGRMFARTDLTGRLHEIVCPACLSTALRCGRPGFARR